MDGPSELGMIGENFDPGLAGRMREDGYESRSGSDNFEGASGDDQDAAAADGPAAKKKKKYHRHTPNQIQELESFFKECPHPDEKQRMELSRRLGLESKQIKFWFQNRRTQMKAMSSPMCTNCGGPAVAGEISYEQHQLRIENARLKEELNRICALTNKFLGRPLSSSASPIPSQGINSNLELAVGRNGFGGLTNAGTTLPMGYDFGDGAMIPSMKPMVSELPFDRSAFVDAALAAMDELIKMAQMDDPLWIKGLDGGLETLNYEEYRRTFSGMKPNGYTTEATRETGMVCLRGLALVETLMDVNRWAEMFPCMISRAAMVDVLSSGTGVPRDNALQVMDAEFQVLSPLVPIRQVRFLRFCKQHSERVWAVVDVSIDPCQDAANAHIFPNCRRLPSGCLIQDMDGKYSKVTWVEHTEYDDNVVHPLLRPLLSTGFGFGAHRWLATLQRQCDCLSVLLCPDMPGEDNTGITSAGRKSMIKLAQRMTRNFCSGVCASSMHRWEKINIGSVGEDVRVMTRKNVSDPGEPPGVVLSAATSVWMPVTQQRLFDFLRNERMRSEWDILSNGGPMQEMVNVAKGQGHGNCVSLLRGSAMNASENNMLILQETWCDSSGALVVYAPVDVSSMNLVMNGGDTTYVALLPSGFAILPGISTSFHGAQPNGALLKPDSDGSGGCILTVGFQILVNSLPSAKLTMESVDTVNNLLACTIQKIKASLTAT
ncbi:hypothetical protein COLO4_14278 [Corchorus olitorius]|uniref:Homeobox domain-containing protein n=1 Tax=Corchorus olitorius TaxID=93759 RepID=A0A1R3JT05_9ROSI|nr:hypothetical protein COLO4_14278 [Corchorus olitorius]